MPFIQADVYKYLVQTIAHHDAVVPIFEGRVHPLASIYKRTALPIIQEKLLKDDLRVRSFYDEIDIKYVDKFPNVDKKTKIGRASCREREEIAYHDGTLKEKNEEGSTESSNYWRLVQV